MHYRGRFRRRLPYQRQDDSWSHRHELRAVHQHYRYHRVVELPVRVLLQRRLVLIVDVRKVLGTVALLSIPVLGLSKFRQLPELAIWHWHHVLHRWLRGELRLLSVHRTRCRWQLTPRCHMVQRPNRQLLFPLPIWLHYQHQRKHCREVREDWLSWN